MHSSSPISGSSAHWRSDDDVLLQPVSTRLRTHSNETFYSNFLPFFFFFCPLPPGNKHCRKVNGTFCCLSRFGNGPKLNGAVRNSPGFLGVLLSPPISYLLAPTLAIFPRSGPPHKRMTHFPSSASSAHEMRGKRSLRRRGWPGPRFAAIAVQLSGDCDVVAVNRAAPPLSFRTARTQLIWHLALMAPGCPWRCSLAAQRADKQREPGLIFRTSRLIECLVESR